MPGQPGATPKLEDERHERVSKVGRRAYVTDANHMTNVIVCVCARTQVVLVEPDRYALGIARTDAAGPPGWAPGQAFAPPDHRCDPKPGPHGLLVASTAA
jgi:hypothetical protein